MNNNKVKTSYKPGFTKNVMLKQVRDDNQWGFTLIELLVVVLIIAILAAVAVPQYRLAVQKSQFANFQAVATSIAKSVHVYYLANGTWPASFSELEVEPSLNPTTNNCVKNDEMYCCLKLPQPGIDSGSIYCGRTDYTLVFQYRYVRGTGERTTQYLCYEKQGGTICKTLPQARGYNSSNDIAIPNGRRTLQSYYIY